MDHPRTGGVAVHGVSSPLELFQHPEAQRAFAPCQIEKRKSLTGNSSLKALLYRKFFLHVCIVLCDSDDSNDGIKTSFGV